MYMFYATVYIAVFRIYRLNEHFQIHMKTHEEIYTTLCIDVTIYKAIRKSRKADKNMNSGTLHKHNTRQNNFICSICLNQKSVSDKEELNEKKIRSCPFCHCSCNYSTDADSTLTKRSTHSKNITGEDDIKVTKNVQTSRADVTQGLTLLNEVLNVFQNKKQLTNPKEKRRTIIFKDIGVSTEDISYRNAKPNLSKSKIFQFSVEDTCNAENKFTIVNSTQPELIFLPHKSLDLINHKSSSIPQMKLEELKQSLKARTQSKDAIDEVNRMFATVKRDEGKDTDNRPMVRSGPRVLPVVKTEKYEVNNDFTHKPIDVQTRKACNERDFHMSSGDSSIKNKCCQDCAKTKGCDNCTYKMCSHYQIHEQPIKQFICKRCRRAK